jgi:hypothetical protein
MNDDTATVIVSVLQITPATGQGRIMAIATVLISIEGIEMEISGVKLIAKRDGNVTVEMPSTRDAMGRETPIIKLPEEISFAIDKAVRKEILETMAERAVSLLPATS